jgi:hypothetical protein
MSESLLITATAPSATSKVKILELCNPTLVVEMKYTGTLSFKWGFKWEECVYPSIASSKGSQFHQQQPRIRMEARTMLHASEARPSRSCCNYKRDHWSLEEYIGSNSGLQLESVRFSPYAVSIANSYPYANRFDIDDRKGLEIVILTALLTFQDANEALHAPEGSHESTPAVSRKASAPTPHPVVLTMDDRPPMPPPKPAPKTGIDRIAELQAIKGDYNEITIDDEGSVQDYAQYCSNLLQVRFCFSTLQ